MNQLVPVIPMAIVMDVCGASLSWAQARRYWDP
jgi:hypothetical protein